MDRPMTGGIEGRVTGATGESGDLSGGMWPSNHDEAADIFALRSAHNIHFTESRSTAHIVSAFTNF
jgi:hypothetical protein